MRFTPRPPTTAIWRSWETETCQTVTPRPPTAAIWRSWETETCQTVTPRPPTTAIWRSWEAEACQTVTPRPPDRHLAVVGDGSLPHGHSQTARPPCGGRGKRKPARSLPIRCWDTNGASTSMPYTWRGLKLKPRLHFSHLWIIGAQFGVVLRITDAEVTCDDMAEPVCVNPFLV